MAVIGTQFTIRDAQGNALCHSAGGSKANADSKRKRAVREAFTRMCEAAGIVTLAGGAMTDVHSGYVFTVAVADSDPRDLMLIDRGHVVADAAGGAFCPCNLVPELRAANKAHGNKSLDPRTFKGVDPRTEWRSVWFEHYASPSKARKAFEAAR